MGCALILHKQGPLNKGKTDAPSPTFVHPLKLKKVKAYQKRSRLLSVIAEVSPLEESSF
jgi:hypothetical protein